MMVRRILLGGLAVAVILMSGLWATGSLDPAAIANEARNVFGTGKPVDDATGKRRDTPPAVSVVKAGSRRFVERMRVTGTLMPRREILVAPEIDGQRVAAFLVDAGDRVTAGQVLARLARENLDAQLAQNSAQIARANANISQARSSITQAEARLVEADAALTRAKPLAKSGYLSESLLDQRQAAATSARAALAITRNVLSAAESEKAAADARQRELEWRLARTEIRAPEAGLVLKRNARIGAIASAQGEAMFRIAAKGDIELLGDVPSDDLVRLAAGQTARVSVGGIDGKITGQVRLIEPEVDIRTRLGKVRISLGANPKLHVGQFAAAMIETRRGDGVAVPVGAVMHDTAGSFLQTVRGGRVETRRIEIGLSADGFIEIRAGIAAGDIVVAKAGTFLVDGDQITPVLLDERPRSSTDTHAKAG